MNTVEFDNWRIPIEGEGWQSLRRRFAFITFDHGGEAIVPPKLVNQPGTGADDGLFCFRECGSAVQHLGQDVDGKRDPAQMIAAMTELLPDLVKPGTLTAKQNGIFQQLQAQRTALRSEVHGIVTALYAEAATGKRWTTREISRLWHARMEGAGKGNYNDPASAIYRAILMAFSEGEAAVTTSVPPLP